jgi:DNA-binding transcriptional LysR family regulator
VITSTYAASEDFIVTARPDAVDLNLRRIRYFLALGAEPHFRRAAEQLRITQPVLSRQIRLLEDELGVELLHRGPPVALTEAGRLLMKQGPALLGDAAALARDLRGTARFAVGFTCGISPAPLLSALDERHPEVHFQAVRTLVTDQLGPLHDGRADVAFVRAPLDARGLATIPLYAEPWVVAMPAGHPLAGAACLDTEALLAERLLQPEYLVAALIPGWLERHTGRAAPDRDRAPDIEEMMEQVVAGLGLVLLPRGAADTYRRPGVAMVPAPGMPPNQVFLAWRDTNPAPLIPEAARLAASLLTA